MKTILLLTLSAMILGSACRRKPTVVYPETRKDDTKESYFDVEVADPYRWLEDDRSEETGRWVEAQNKVTFDYLSHIPFRGALKEKMTRLADYEKYSSPFKKNGKYYFFKNDGLQNQSVMYVQESLDAEPSVFLDPNKLSEDGTVALAGISFSHNGKYFAYSISRSGSDWQEIYVVDLASGKRLDDHISWVKFSGAEWQGDGFYYSAYNSPSTGKEFSHINENHTVYYHRIGTPQAEDRLIYQRKEFPKRFYAATVSDDERILFITEAGAGRGNALYMKDLTREETKIVRIADNLDYNHTPIEVLDGRILFLTNDGAPRYKIMEATVAQPERKYWKELVPEMDAVLASADVIGNHLILVYDKDAAHHAYRFGTDGKLLNEIELPAPGSVGFSGNKNDSEAFYLFSSFTVPASIYRYDTEKNTSALYRSPAVDFHPEDFVTEQLFFPSKDSTQVPMFLIYKKGMQLNGHNPVLLYGYGGFGISLNPGFSINRLPFIESGGIYVQVNLRGGSEYGEEWHIAGTKMQKQHVFDDFIAAAEYLIANRYTNPDKIAIMGGSNGGLLVGACMNQRPDLFRVAIPQVGVMDMLRYHKFTIGWNWASDYGTSEDSPEMFEYLNGYSPLHNIRKDTPYPATLITTADHDDRVVPAHSFKYAATLQEANSGPNPTLIRIDTKSGHGSGKPMAKILEEAADIYSFIMYHLEMQPAK